MLYIIIAITTILLGLWIYQSFVLSEALKPFDTRLRGFLKHYNAGEFPELNSKIRIWFIFTFASFLAVLILLIYRYWNTDYNFFIAIYPFFWHYSVFRYFLWEKSDLTEIS